MPGQSADRFPVNLSDSREAQPLELGAADRDVADGITGNFIAGIRANLEAFEGFVSSSNHRKGRIRNLAAIIAGYLSQTPSMEVYNRSRGLRAPEPEAAEVGAP